MKKLTKAEIKILEHVDNQNGLTGVSIAANATGYAFSTVKRVFKKYTYADYEHPFGYIYVKDSIKPTLDYYLNLEAKKSFNS